MKQPETPPRVVIGAPLYNGSAHLASSLDSLLAQSMRDFALVLVDDRSTDGTRETAREYARTDPRVTLFENERRLGLAANWRKCFEHARTLAPEAEYFAWGSDHDLWAPDWLQKMVDELDAHPEAVLVYPRSLRIDGEGNVIRASWDFSTHDVTTPRERMRRCIDTMVAGSMVYGLMRVEALESAGVLRQVMAPDRLLMFELAFRGTFRQVPEELWQRRFAGLYSAKRQRASLFGGRPPWHAHLSHTTVHTAVLAWHYVIRGQTEVIGRGAAASAVEEFLRSSVVRHWRRRLGRFRKLQRQRAKALRLRMHRSRRHTDRRVKRAGRRVVHGRARLRRGFVLAVRRSRRTVRLYGLGVRRRLVRYQALVRRPLTALRLRRRAEDPQ